MKRVCVADIMTRDPMTVDPDENLLNCVKKMVKKRVGSLILVKDEKVVGFLSEKDVMWVLVKKSKKDFENIKVKDIAAKKVATIRPDETIQKAIIKMKQKKFKRLPVIEKGNLVGIITTRDILSFNPEFYPELDELAKIKEEQEKLKRIKKAKDKYFTGEGICEECGERDMLIRFNGMLICESCKTSM